LTTKIHLTTNGAGKAVRIIIGPGHESDFKQASALLKGLRPDAVLADKGYDADWLVVDELREAGVREIVIPSRAKRKVQRQINKDLYKKRNTIERYFNRLKNWRRVATRFDKMAANFYSIVCLAAAIINHQLSVNTA
jgi:putative transposase